MLATVLRTDKSMVMQKLADMGLSQIAMWIELLPEERWEFLFHSRWPALAKQCGIQEGHQPT